MKTKEFCEAVKNCKLQLDHMQRMLENKDGEIREEDLAKCGRIIEKIDDLHLSITELLYPCESDNSDIPYEHMQLMEDGWHLAADGVFCRCLGNHEFEFLAKEEIGQKDDEAEYIINNQLVDIEDYSEEDLESAAEAEGTNLRTVRNLRGKSTAETIALFMYNRMDPYDINGYGMLTGKEADQKMAGYMKYGET